MRPVNEKAAEGSAGSREARVYGERFWGASLKSIAALLE